VGDYSFGEWALGEKAWSLVFSVLSDMRVIFVKMTIEVLFQIGVFGVELVKN
jgi:hypothetical protein